MSEGRLARVERRTSGTAPFETRKIYSSAAKDALEFRVYQREDLLPGDVIKGPLVIEEPGTTTIVDTGDNLSIEDHGCLIIDINASEAMGGR